MSSGFFEPDYEGMKEALQEAAVTGKLAEIADRILESAKSDAESAGLADYAAALHVETGIRPKGRPYARVIADDPDATAHEYGDDHFVRRRILGKASGVRIF